MVVKVHRVENKC